MHGHPATRGIRSTLIGMLFNLVLAAIKTTAGVMGNSYALVADGIESLSDVFSSFVVYLGLRIAMVPPDESHPYGHGKAEPIAAIVVGGALLVASGVITLESIRAIRTPHAVPAPWTLIVLALVMAVKETLYRYVARVGKQVESTAVSTDAWHHRSDAITSACAFTGITVAVVRVNPELTVREGHDIAHRVKDAVRGANPRVSDVLVHVEPEGWH
jgi:cation diffusion facilitator family transporter